MLRVAGDRTAHPHYAGMSERPVSLPKIINDAAQSQTSARAESIVVQLPPGLARRINSLAHRADVFDVGVTAGDLKRYDRKPKRLASRKLYMLQGLPGVGPALAPADGTEGARERKRERCGDATHGR